MRTCECVCEYVCVRARVRRTCKARGRLCHASQQSRIRHHGPLTRETPQYVLSSLRVRQAKGDLPVETTWSAQSWVQRVRPVYTHTHTHTGSLCSPGASWIRLRTFTLS